MRMARRITFALATVAGLALGACTSVSSSGTVEPPAPSAAVPMAPAPAQSGAATHDGTTFVLPPEPGYNPDNDFEAP